jgi:chromosome segregation ATPase
MWEAQTDLTKLEDKLIQLENSSNEKQKQIDSLELNLSLANQDLNKALLYSESLEKQQAETLQQLETVSKSLKKQDTQLAVYRITLMIAVPTIFTIGLITGWKLREYIQ